MLFEGFIVSSVGFYMWVVSEMGNHWASRRRWFYVGMRWLKKMREQDTTSWRRQREKKIRLFLLVMPAAFFRTSEANRSQVPPSPNSSPKRFIQNPVWIIPTTEGQR
jgi:hypothetical protein